MCKSCTFFRQHYTFDNRKIHQVYCGHCTFSRPKAKHPDARICENYVENKSAKDSFVTKEYLTKALLEYVLKLELLPEIYDTEM